MAFWGLSTCRRSAAKRGLRPFPLGVGGAGFVGGWSSQASPPCSPLPSKLIPLFTQSAGGTPADRRKRQIARRRLWPMEFAAFRLYFYPSAFSFVPTTQKIAAQERTNHFRHTPLWVGKGSRQPYRERKRNFSENEISGGPFKALALTALVLAPTGNFGFIFVGTEWRWPASCNHVVIS